MGYRMPRPTNMRVKQGFLPTGWTVRTAGYRSYEGKPIWRLFHGKMETGLYDDRDIAIRAAWRDAGRWLKSDLRRPELALGTPDALRSRWREDIARLKGARKAAGGKKRKASGKTESGYRPCACRDCMETVIGGPGAMCWECEEAGCEPNKECQAEGAYGGGAEWTRPSGGKKRMAPVSDLGFVREALARYGAFLDDTAHIVTRDGKRTSVLATIKNKCLRFEGDSGNLLFTGGLMGFSVANFVENFWY